MTEASRSTVFHVPESQEWLAAVGRVVVRHEHLHYMTRMLFRRLKNMDVRAALETHPRASAGYLRKLVQDRGREELPASVLRTLTELLDSAATVSDRRNAIVHRLVVADSGGGSYAMVLNEAGETVPAPSVEEVNRVADAIQAVLMQIIRARDDGSLGPILNFE